MNKNLLDDLENGKDISGYSRAELVNTIKHLFSYKQMFDESCERYNTVIIDIGNMIGVDLSDEPRYKWLKIALTDFIKNKG